MRTHTPLPATSSEATCQGRPRSGGPGWAWLAMGVLLVAATACEAPPQDFQTPDGEAEATAAPDEGILLSAGIDRLVFAPGDSMRVLLQLSNRLDAPRSLLFPTAQRYELLVVDGHNEIVYRWSGDRAFAQVQEDVELPARGNGPEWVEWLPLDLPEGTYRLRASIPIPGSDLEAELPFEVTDQAGGDG